MKKKTQKQRNVGISEDERPVYNIPDAAYRLGLSIKDVGEEVNYGRLKGTRNGPSLRLKFSEKDLREYEIMHRVDNSIPAEFANYIPKHLKKVPINR